MNKKFIFGILFLLVLSSFVFAEDESSVKDVPKEIDSMEVKELNLENPINQALHKDITVFGKTMIVLDFVLFILVFLSLSAITYEILSLIGLFDKALIKLAISLIVVFLMNFEGLILRAVSFFKDWQKIAVWVSSLTLKNIILGLLAFAIVFALIKLFRLLIKWAEKEYLDEVKWQDAFREGMRRKFERWKDKNKID